VRSSPAFPLRMVEGVVRGGGGGRDFHLNAGRRGLIMGWGLCVNIDLLVGRGGESKSFFFGNIRTA
jgi:hypothetical protein